MASGGLALRTACLNPRRFGGCANAVALASVPRCNVSFDEPANRRLQPTAGAHHYFTAAGGRAPSAAETRALAGQRKTRSLRASRAKDWAGSDALARSNDLRNGLGSFGGNWLFNTAASDSTPPCILEQRRADGVACSVDRGGSLRLPSPSSLAGVGLVTTRRFCGWSAGFLFSRAFQSVSGSLEQTG